MWLERGGLIRLTSSESDGGEDRIASLIHDGFGPALEGWAKKVTDHPGMETSLPIAIVGDSIFRRPNVHDESEALTPEVLGGGYGHGWKSGEITAYFRDIVFDHCDFSNTVFNHCRFKNVVLLNCLTHGTQFLNCEFVDGFRLECDRKSLRSVSTTLGLRSEIRGLTLRNCELTDGVFEVIGYDGRGLFLEDFKGAWHVKDSSFSHMIVAGSHIPGAGPGVIENSPRLEHLEVLMPAVGGITIIGEWDQVSSFSEIDSEIHISRR